MSDKPNTEVFEGWIFGPRIRLEDVRPGSTGVVLDRNGAHWNDDERSSWLDADGHVQMPKVIAGAIGVWRSIDGAGRVRWFARCSCGMGESKHYKRQHEPMLRVWGNRHRCGLFAQQLVPDPPPVYDFNGPEPS